MRFLLTTDLRGETKRIPQLLDAVKSERADALIFAGNIIGEDERVEAFRNALQRGETPVMEEEALRALEDKAVQAYEAFFDAMGQLDIPVFVIPGYLDAPERLYLQASLNHEVVEPNVHMVHRSFVPLGGQNLAITGFGGGISEDLRQCRYVIVYPEWEVLFGFEFLRHVKQQPFFVFHTPPRRGDIDLEKGVHVGKHVIEELIKTYDPRYAVVGGALDGQGTVYIGPTLVINPGPLRDGHYAVLDTADDSVEFKRLS